MTDPLVELTQRQWARWDDPKTQEGAQKRAEEANRINRAIGKDANMRRAVDRVASAPSFRGKITWMRKLADDWAFGIKQVAPCKEGCDHCCKQAVMITDKEAQVLGEEIGVRPAKPKQYRMHPASEYDAVPCPFLRESRCSIYEHRPMACRLLFNMDADNLLCEVVPGTGVKVPYANAMGIHQLLLEAHFKGEPTYEALEALKMADLRDYFPKGKHG